jgi:peptidoglycan/LPS O-acetylase OafA/YrhL
VSAFGVISYSVYLIHQPVIEFTTAAVKKLPPSDEVNELLLYLLLLLLFVAARWLYRIAEVPGIEVAKWVIKERRTMVGRAEVVRTTNLG